MCEPIHYLPIRVGGRKEKGAIFVLLHRKRQSEAPICHHVLHIFFLFFSVTRSKQKLALFEFIVHSSMHGDITQNHAIRADL